MKVLITGGAGYVGSTLAHQLSRYGHTVICLDNLSRKGSEIHALSLAKAGISLIRGDIRNPSDFPYHEKFDTIIECAAEPSVLAGYTSSPKYLLDTNLQGTVHTLEFAREKHCHFILLSTSRVYSVQSLNEITFNPIEQGHLTPTPIQTIQGVSPYGISNTFPTLGIKSLYGASKLCSEILAQEYAAAYNIPVTINRCGVLAGPGQLGKIDQGVFSFWMWRHLKNLPLSYIGYGGLGLQTRDLLDARDLSSLLLEQIKNPNFWNGWQGNVGGGPSHQLSLQETTQLCQEITGNQVRVSQVSENRPMDIPWYVTDNSLLFTKTNWRPTRSPKTILEDTFLWLKNHEDALATLA
jgi:CDP-paratose 2-epimerase